jgi:hypothetical protein
MSVCSRTDTAIRMRAQRRGDRSSYRPLSIILAPRELEYVEQDTRDVIEFDMQPPTPEQVYQYSARHDTSRVTANVLVARIPEGFLNLVAPHMAQLRGDAEDTDMAGMTRSVAAAPAAFARCKGNTNEEYRCGHATGSCKDASIW